MARTAALAKGAVTKVSTGIPALTASALAKSYHGVQALSNVSTMIPTGSITGIVGPNGAGKSTLMKAWTGTERPDAGFVEVMGIDPWRDRQTALRHIAYIPQSVVLDRVLSVSDHIEMAAALRGGHFRFDRTTAYLGDVGIPLGRRGRSLSGGQQVQVALAMAFGLDASILLLDEPLANLDPLARTEFLAAVVSIIRSDGLTAVLSSHVVADIEQACDRLLVIGAGVVALDASIDEARLTHRVVTGTVDPVEGPSVIGAFVDRDGQHRTLIGFHEGDPETGKSAVIPRLEDIVLGYLAAARRQP